jgi:IS4 transposase
VPSGIRRRVQTSFAAVKLHVQLGLVPSLPVLCVLTEGKQADVTFLDRITYAPGGYYVMDRGYFDLERLHAIHLAKATYVTRAKCNTSTYVVASRKVQRESGLRCDQTVRFNSSKGRRAYPNPLRRIRVADPDTGHSLVLLTNNFELPASTVADIYRLRWQVELFFRWIKQHLRLRAFFAHSRNGAAVQVWTALAAYLLVAIARKRLHLPQELATILQVVSISALEKVPLHDLLTESITRNDETDFPIQLEFRGL